MVSFTDYDYAPGSVTYAGTKPKQDSGFRSQESGVGDEQG